MHGHVAAAWLAQNLPFADPAQLLVVPDHYVTRMLVSQGVTLDRLGIPRADGGPVRDRPARDLAALLHALAALPRHAVPVLARARARRGLRRHRAPSAETADELYDPLAGRAAPAGVPPRALLDRFGIEILGTTDPPLATCSTTPARSSRAGAAGVPTFRPDAVVYLDGPAGGPTSTALAAASPASTPASYEGYLAALAQRRRHFVAAWAPWPPTTATSPPTPPRCRRRGRADLRRRARRRGQCPAEAQAFAAHMLFQMAAMSVEDGLVMQIHPGVLPRPPQRRRRGPTARTRASTSQSPSNTPAALRPMLDAFGTDPSVPLHRLHHRRDGLLAASWPRSPARTRRSGSARPGGSSTPPTACAGSARRPPRRPASTTRPASSTTPAPSARSRPGTTCTRRIDAGYLAEPRRRAPARRGRSRGDRRRPHRHPATRGLRPALSCSPDVCSTWLLALGMIERDITGQ